MWASAGWMTDPPDRRRTPEYEDRLRRLELTVDWLSN